jgi:hypothetical protein
LGAPAPDTLSFSPIAKRLAWLAGLVACTLLPSFASAGDSGALQLRGQIALACSIRVDATQVATSLDLTQSETDLSVASVTETCNSGTGYTIKVSSQGNGSLYGPLDAVTYQLKYDEVEADLSASQVSPVLVTNVTGKTGAEGVTKDVTISYSTDGSLSGGTYEDTLVFTVAAK